MELVQGDVTEPDSLQPAFAGVDVVYHTAAAVTDWGPWRDFQAVTIDGTRNALEAAARAGAARFLHVSSDAVYAHRFLGHRISEETPLETSFAWWDYYRRSKTAAEHLVWQYHHWGRVPATAVRPGLVLGERDRVSVPGAVEYLKRKNAVYLGNGHNRLPCVYAGDVARLCLTAAAYEGAPGQAYNAVSHEVVTQRDLITTVAGEAGLEHPQRSVPLPALYAVALGMELISVLSGRRSRPALTRFAVTFIGADYIEVAVKAERELGWRGEVSMREAVKRCLSQHQEMRPKEAVS